MSSRGRGMEAAVENVRAYWDAYAAHLEAPGKAWGSKEFFSAIKSQHDRVYAYANRILNLPTLRGRSVLELGCGMGLDTVEFARHGATVTALDLSPTCIDLARRHLAYHGLQAALEMGNAEELPYPADSFDVVVARGLLMFTPDDSGLVDEIFRVLRPGGEAHILLHNRFSWYVLLAKISGTNLLRDPQDPPVNKLYSPWQAARLFDRFSSVEMFFDRLPLPTERPGTLAQVYNRLFVPLVRWIPAPLIRPVGFYIIFKAMK